MRTLLALIRLDLKLFFRDRRALLLLFVIPIGIASFMGLLTGNPGEGAGKRGGMALLMVDLDQSAVSRGVVNAFADDDAFRLTVTNESAARALVLGGQRPVALVLPAGFGAGVLPGFFDAHRRPVIAVLHDPSRSLERQIVEGMLIPKVATAIARSGLNGEAARSLVREGFTNLARAATLDAGDRRLLRNLLERAERTLEEGETSPATNAATAPSFSLPLPFTIRQEALTRNEAVYNGYAHSFAGMSVQFILMAMVDLAVALLRERESGVFRRLRSTPLSRGTLLAAKGISWSIISLISLVGCFAFAILVFRVRIAGSWIGFAGVLASTALLSGSLGLMLAAIGRTPAGTRGISIAVILLLVMVGGAWMPSFIFPQWLQRVSVITPTRWAMDGLDAMTWRGLGLDAALAPIGVCLGFAALFGLIAWTRFQWDES